ncbi:flagellar hook-associated protein FlgK [Liquorilactobacillus sicerae]|uniref:flagellar hook-associated protein FlgK n=1 Tax=Liquorilactobacillus sicerae TaxID=1416943 RepID=UPI002480AB48|nr:flagellar hook-associated protein FlgK [Liquorilactobacillus sicerae]
MSLFGALQVSKSGLNADQVALETTGNNISNVNTDGYSRQEVDIEENSTIYEASIKGNLGTGVDVDGVTRTVDDYVRSQERDANSNYQYYSTKSTELGDLEDILDEPSDNGLVTQLSTLTTAWNTLAEDTDSSTDKTSVVEDANTLAETLNQMSDDISDLQSNITDNVVSDVASFNSDLSQLQTVNKEIYTMVNDGQTPNDLLDERDSLLKDMSGYTDISTTFDSYGRASVSIDGQDVLTADSKSSLSVVTASSDSGSTVAKNGDTDDSETVSDDYDVNTILLTTTDSDGNTSYSTLDVTSGSIGGLKDSSSEVTTRLQELNNFAETLAKTVNTVYTSGESSTSGFFDLGDDDNYAKNIAVESTLTDDADNLTAGTTSSSDETTIASAMADLADTDFEFPVTDSELSSFSSSSLSFSSTTSSGETYSEAFSNIVTKNATSKSEADDLSTSTDSVLSELETQDESVSGVSLTEEFSNLIQYQRGYQANAKVLNTISEMLDTLINDIE